MAFKILAIGEVLWDLFPAGPQLGGAPANFAYHAHALGGSGRFISRIGQDDLGNKIFDRLTKLKLPTDLLQIDDAAPTGTVTVTLSGRGIPSYTINPAVAWDHLQVTPGALEAVRAANAICFGTLAQRSVATRSSIQKLVAATPADALIVFDINLRQNFYSREIIEQSLQRANVLKLNDDELVILAKMFGLNGGSREQVKQLSEQFHLRLIALTRGEQGSVLYRDGEWSDCASQPVKIVDTVGAGDAFTAAMVLGLLQKRPLDKVNQLANEVARYVCSQAGAMPPVPGELRDKFTKI